MRKRERQATIQRLIQSEPIERQEDLVARLTEMKIPVTQATISRDIKEMQLVKIPAGEGHYRYRIILSIWRFCQGRQPRLRR